MKIIVPGEPVPKGRPRFNRSTGSVYTPATTRSYEQAIGFLAMAQREKIKEGCAKVGMLFYTRKQADLDNLIKSGLDGLNGQAFTDDKQVSEIYAARVYSNNPRVEIIVEECEQRTEEE